MIKIGVPFVRYWFDRKYVWTLEKESKGLYVLKRTLNGKPDNGVSPIRRGSLSEMRREFTRQQMVVSSEYFGGFDKVI